MGGGELGFELVAKGHEFVDFGDDAVLFCKERDAANADEVSAWSIVIKYSVWPLP